MPLKCADFLILHNQSRGLYTNKVDYSNTLQSMQFGELGTIRCSPGMLIQENLKANIIYVNLMVGHSD